MIFTIYITILITLLIVCVVRIWFTMDNYDYRDDLGKVADCLAVALVASLITKVIA